MSPILVPIESSYATSY